MSTKNSDYWAGRFKDLEKAQNRKAVSAIAEIERQYNRAIKDVESKIRTWYQRFADNNGITMAEARKWLDAKQLKELHWDVNEYIKYGKDNEINQQWMKELENASAKMHISRLQALELEIRQSLEKLTADQLGTTEGTLEDVYRTGYYHTAYEIAKGTQIGTDIAKLDQRTVEKILQKPWAPDGKNFSDRIWENKNKLLGTVHSELSKNILTGADPQKAIDEIAKKMNTSKHNAGRLVMTEEAYFNSLSQGDMFKELDVEKYEIVATLDSHTSEICQDMDGKVFPMVDYEAGTTAPPFHVYCRSTTAPWFPEDYGVKGERAARDTDDDKTYMIDADITYKQWMDKYVKSAPIEGIRSAVDVKFDADVKGTTTVQGGFSVRDEGGKKTVTINKRNTTQWDDLPGETKRKIFGGKAYNLQKGDYDVTRYVEGSQENIERDEIADALGGEYLGFTYKQTNGQYHFIDFYKVGDDLLYSVGKADVKKTLDKSSLDAIHEVALEREKQIIEAIGETNLKNIKVREGNEWERAMREFHRTIHADDQLSIISDEEYDAVASPRLFRGIAPQSMLRTDIKSTSTIKEMAEEFYTSESVFPSRGVYGDGVAYCSPAYKHIALNYATNHGHNKHGGAIIEFKLKSDAKVITYEDAVAIFDEMKRKGGSELLFSTQRRTEHEVGKAMNALGYDAIIKHNGDHTGEDFYVILNRGALVTKKNYAKYL